MAIPMRTGAAIDPTAITAAIDPTATIGHTLIMADLTATMVVGMPMVDLMVALAYVYPAASGIRPRSCPIASEGTMARLNADGNDLREIETPLHSSYSLAGVVRFLSSVSTTKTASSFAGSVLLALRLTGWLEPGVSKKLSPAR